MAVEALSGSIYYDAAKTVQKPKTETTNTQGQNAGTTNINITEIPATTKTSNSNQMGKEQEKGQKDATTSEQQIKDAISRVNSKMNKRTRCEFSYHEETKRVSIKILDQETQEVIREIPPEETLQMVEKMWELAGLLVDEKR